MDKIQGLEQWDLSKVATETQVAKVSVFISYPKISSQLLTLASGKRQQFVTQKMRDNIDLVLETNKLLDWQLLKTGGPGSRYHGVCGEIKVADIAELALLSVVESVRVEATNGRKKRLVTPRKKPRFYCVKMTVAIQIEGREKGMQSYEERYVLFQGILRS